MKYAIRAILSTALLTGCTTRTASSTPRTAIEQLLLSTATDQAFDKINLSKLAGAKTYIDFSELQSYDVEYVKSAFRTQIASGGAVVVEKPEEADFIVRISYGALGSEHKDTLFDIPVIPVPDSPMTFPELALWKHIEQDGIAKFLITVHSNDGTVFGKHYYGKAELS